jgi:hypothetical protein
MSKKELNFIDGLVEETDKGLFRHKKPGAPFNFTDDLVAESERGIPAMDEIVRKKKKGVQRGKGKKKG